MGLLDKNLLILSNINRSKPYNSLKNGQVTPKLKDKWHCQSDFLLIN